MKLNVCGECKINGVSTHSTCMFYQVLMFGLEELFMKKVRSLKCWMTVENLTILRSDKRLKIMLKIYNY